MGRGDAAAPSDAFRPTWRERASEYILAGGGTQSGGNRRGPHERGLMRDGQVGLAGQPNRGPEGPNEMFPQHRVANYGPFEPTQPSQDWGKRKPPKPPRGRGRGRGRGGDGDGDGAGGGSYYISDPASDHNLAAVSGDSALEREHMTERGRERISRGR